METHSGDNESSISKDGEFKIHLSTEDINKIDEVVRRMSYSSNIIEKSNEIKISRSSKKIAIVRKSRY